MFSFKTNGGGLKNQLFVVKYQWVTTLLLLTSDPDYWPFSDWYLYELDQPTLMANLVAPLEHFKQCEVELPTGYGHHQLLLEGHRHSSHMKPVFFGTQKSWGIFRVQHLGIELAFLKILHLAMKMRFGWWLKLDDTSGLHRVYYNPLRERKQA